MIGALSILIGLSILLLIARNGLGLQGRRKIEAMEGLSYDYKLFLSLYSIYIPAIFLQPKKIYQALAIFVVLVDLLFGFRGALGIFFVSYILAKPVRPGAHAFALIFVAILALIGLIIAKETVYFTRGFAESIEIFANLHARYGSHFFSFINAESASNSAVFNELVGLNFSVPWGYVLNSLISVIPFMSSLGLETPGFAFYMKAAVFGSEGGVFSAGMPSVLFTLGNNSLLFLGIYCIVVFFQRTEKALRNGMFLSRILYGGWAVVLLVHFFRSDLLFIIGILRNQLIVVLFLFGCFSILKRFGKKLPFRKTPSGKAVSA